MYKRVKRYFYKRVKRYFTNLSKKHYPIVFVVVRVAIFISLLLLWWIYLYIGGEGEWRQALEELIKRKLEIIWSISQILFIPFIIGCIFYVSYAHYKFRIEISALLIAIAACYLQYHSLVEQRKLASWQIIGSRSSGNSGKKDAIESLAKQHISLSGIDMSARSNGGLLNKENKWENPVYLRFLDIGMLKTDLSYSNFEGANLIESNFKKSYLYRANFKSAILYFSDFDKTNLHYANFKSALLHCSNFNRSNLRYADFSKAVLYKSSFRKADIFNANFTGANLSDTNFEESQNFNTAIFKKNYLTFIEKIQESKLPIAPEGYKFEFNGLTKGAKRYIKISPITVITASETKNEHRRNAMTVSDTKKETPKGHSKIVVDCN